jgi:hypothetical protein
MLLTTMLGLAPGNEAIEADLGGAVGRVALLR